MSKYSSYLRQGLSAHLAGISPVESFQHSVDGVRHITEEIGHVIEQFSPDDAALIIVALRCHLKSMERIGGEHAVDVANKFMSMTTFIDMSRIVKGGSDHE